MHQREKWNHITGMFPSWCAYFIFSSASMLILCYISSFWKYLLV